MAQAEPMDPVDVTWLRMDRPTNRMIIVGLLILDGPADVARIEATLAERILAFHRFRQRAETRAAGLTWCDDPNFDIAHHIKRVRLPGDGGKSELQRLVAELAGRALDFARPLWEFHIVEDYDGGAAVITRIHHAIADGVALVDVLLSLTDENPNPSTSRGGRDIGKRVSGIAWEDMFGVAGRLIGAGLRLSDQALKASIGIATHPSRTVDYVRQGTGIAAELAYLLLMPSDTQTRLKGTPVGDKRVAWADPIALPEVKAVSRALGCSINDMLLAAVAGAIKGYLAEKGDPTQGVELRALVPINLRPPGGGQELGNRFGIIAVELPVGLESPLERVYEVRRRMEALKTSYEPSVTLGLFAGLGYAPQVVQDRLFDLLLSRATAVMTNVPGTSASALSGRLRGQTGDVLGPAIRQHRHGRLDPVVQRQGSFRPDHRRRADARPGGHRRPFCSRIRTIALFRPDGGLGRESAPEVESEPIAKRRVMRGKRVGGAKSARPTRGRG